MPEKVTDDSRTLFCNENAVSFDIRLLVCPVAVTAVFLCPVSGKIDQLPQNIITQVGQPVAQFYDDGAVSFSISSYESEGRKLYKDYLDKNFARASATIFGEDGRPQVKQVVAWLDDYKQIVKTLTEVQLFYIIQDQFKKILPDKSERDKFIIQVLKDWYNKKISKNYSLSVY